METFANKKIRKCDMENKQKPFECIQGFLASKINCSTPWSKNSTKAPCQDVEDYKTYFNHYLNLLKMDYEHQLSTFDCLNIDCDDYYWKAKRIGTFPDWVPGIQTVIVSILAKTVRN